MTVGIRQGLICGRSGVVMGNRVQGDSFYLMFNAHSESVEFVLPESKWGEQWIVAFDTDELPTQIDVAGRHVASGEHLHVKAWSVVLLRQLKG